MLTDEVLEIVSSVALGFEEAGKLTERGDIDAAREWEEPATAAMEKKIAEANLTDDEAKAVRRRLQDVKNGHGLTSHDVGHKYLTCGML